MKINLKIWLLLLVAFSGLTISVTYDEPFHQFEVQGTVSRPGGGSLENFAVTLYGKPKTESTFYPLNDFMVENNEFPDFAVALTDGAGKFKVRITSGIRDIEQLKIAVVFSDKATVFSDIIYVSEATPKEIQSRFNYSKESGCSCENSISSELITTGYQYLYKDKSLILPF